MLVERLELFMVLAREEHFGRAAEQCGVTQPTLSFAIKQLEQMLGVMLVERGSRFRGLTPEGRQVLAWARRIVSDTRSLQEEMRAARAGLSGRLRIAAIPTALAIVAGITTPFHEKHPGVSFSVLSRTSVEILSMLGNFDIDAGITYIDHEPLGNVITVPLYSERYHLVVSGSTPLAARRTVSWAEVAQLPLCLLTSDMQNRRIIDSHLAQTGLTVRPTLESNSMVVLLSHVRTGIWSSIMPLNLATALDFGGSIRCIPIVEPQVQHMVGMVVPKREPHTPLVAALLAALRKAEGLSASNPEPEKLPAF